MLSSGWYGQAKLTPFEPKKEFLVVRMAASLLLLDCNNNNNNINWRYSRLGCFIYFSCCLFGFFFWSFSCSLRPRCRYRRRSSSSICFTRNRWFVFIFYSYFLPFISHIIQPPWRGMAYRYSIMLKHGRLFNTFLATSDTISIWIILSALLRSISVSLKWFTCFLSSSFSLSGRLTWFYSAEQQLWQV